ncbi:hypothetical protein ISF_02485 [Cordyceps fumosorosea ARSEF 2679]|uniref:Uncharacterized protein n=1 Tax=Cordyceps fumosorosea (strain ARSEF 2679) TaxID=1081104 RepID=A0A168BT07_CORFA|nr:hypothetical protein ISF_02485 [Cordyceps fumosorosea ARSEF 2679]OAA70511.1 hypothetical protein ISF_02485 [Cordyceps fumosorosea ARSEF 2679]
MLPEKTDPGSARRTRKWATKTRTGCITCRDASPPAATAKATPSSGPRILIPPLSPPPPPPSPPSTTSRSPYERFALAQSQAAIVALLALTRRSAAHEGGRGGGGLTDPDKEAILLACTLFTGLCCLQEDYEQAAQHAKAGNRLYWRWKYWRHSDDEDEEVQDEEDDDDDFTCTTRDYRADNHGARRPGCVLTTKSLTAVFTHFEMQFCSRFLSIDIPEWRWRDRAHRCSPAPFAGAADAYTELQPLLTGYCHLGRWLSVPRAPAELVTVGHTVAAYAREMLTWRAKFAALLDHQGASLSTLPPPPSDDDEHEEDEEAYRILCLRLLWMALETCFDQTEATGEMVWDERTPTLERVTTFAETHFAARWHRRRRPSPSPSPSPPTATTNRSFTFSFVMSACEVLTWIGTNCRDGGVRRRLIALLHGWPERDGIIDPRLLALVVHTVMVLEENATTGMQAPHEGCACEPGEDGAEGGGGKFICALHRVCLIDTQFLGERSATIVLTTTGMLKDGLPPYETSVSW